MPRNPNKVRCGEPGCRAWAVRGSDPPLCSAHAGRTEGAGAPPANQNALTHGFYGQFLHKDEIKRELDPEGFASLAGEITIARVALQRLYGYLAEAEGLTHWDYVRLSTAAFHGARTVARLLREHHRLTKEARLDPLSEAINFALDSLSEEWGVEL